MNEAVCRDIFQESDTLRYAILKSTTNFHVSSLTKDETQIFYILVNLLLFTNLNGHKLPVFKTMAKYVQGQLVQIFLHFFFPRMEVNHQRIK